VCAAFVTGAIVMGFEMLARAISPPTSAAASTPGLADLDGARRALCRIFLGVGLPTDTRHAGPGGDRGVGPPICWSCRHSPSRCCNSWYRDDDIRSGSLAAALAMCSFPSPSSACIRHSRSVCCCIPDRVRPRFGNGLRRVDRQHRRTLGTTFFLIPLIGSRASPSRSASWPPHALLLIAAARLRGKQRTSAAVLAATLVAYALLLRSRRYGREPFDPEIRAHAQAQERPDRPCRDGLQHIFVSKKESVLKMSFQWKGWEFRNRSEPVRPDDLPMLYSRAITIAAIYPKRSGHPDPRPRRRDPSYLALSSMQRSIPSSSILA